MTDKKDPWKFTIRFNICDPQHKAVIDLLSRQGRSKAQFLVSAVLHYINCKGDTRGICSGSKSGGTEEMILAILAKNQSYLKKAARAEAFHRTAGCGYLRCIRTYAARRRSRIGTMVWWAGWCGIDPELS